MYERATKMHNACEWIQESVWPPLVIALLLGVENQSMWWNSGECFEHAEYAECVECVERVECVECAECVECVEWIECGMLLATRLAHRQSLFPSMTSPVHHPNTMLSSNPSVNLTSRPWPERGRSPKA